MNKTIIGVLVALIALVVVSGAGMYNSLVTANESIDAKWSQVENNLQRRADLLPNLMETTRAFAAQEKEVFTRVADARAKLAGATTVAETAQADAEFSQALSRLLVVVENYPQLKSDANFRQLSDELAGTENRLATARKDYNEAVQLYNTRIKRFPTNTVAGIGGFNPRDYFRAQPDTQNVPQIKF